MAPLLSVVEAAAVLSMSPGWLRQQVRDRQVPHTRIGGQIRFTEDHLAEIVGAGEQRPRPAVPAPRTPTGRRKRRHPAPVTTRDHEGPVQRAQG